MAIVTGANRGIGKAIATRLASDGFTVAMIARNSDALAKVEQEISDAGGQASSHICDLADCEGFASTIESIVEQYGRLDVLVNNARHDERWAYAPYVSGRFRCSGEC